MTGDDFNQASAFLTTEVQGALNRHFPVGVTATQVDAIVSALAMIVSMFAAQDTAVRSVFNRVLDHSIDMIGGNERFRERTAAVRAGESPERGLGISIPDLWPLVTEARAGAASPCLHCVLRAAIVTFYGGPITEPDKAAEMLTAIAKVAATACIDAGEGGATLFAHQFNAYSLAVTKARSTQGMTEQ